MRQIGGSYCDPQSTPLEAEAGQGAPSNLPFKPISELSPARHGISANITDLKTLVAVLTGTTIFYSPSSLSAQNAYRSLIGVLAPDECCDGQSCVPETNPLFSAFLTDQRAFAQLPQRR